MGYLNSENIKQRIALNRRHLIARLQWILICDPTYGECFQQLWKGAVFIIDLFEAIHFHFNVTRKILESDLCITFRCRLEVGISSKGIRVLY